jgi:hypothetical protein
LAEIEVLAPILAEVLGRDIPTRWLFDPLTAN